MNKDLLITQLVLIAGFFMLWSTHTSEQFQFIKHQQEEIGINQDRIIEKHIQILEIAMSIKFLEGMKDANLFHRDLQY